MTSIHQSYLFSVLVAVTVLPLDASSLLTLRQSNDPTASMKKCLKHLEKQQADANSRSVFSQQLSPNHICGNFLDHLLTRIKLLPDQTSETQFGSGNTDPLLLSDAHPAAGVIYPNLGPGRYAKFDTTKRKNNIPEKLATIRSNLLEDLPNNDISNQPDSFPLPKYLLLDKSTADFIQSVPVGKNSLKTNSFLKNLLDSDNLKSKTHYLFEQRGNLYDDGVHDYDNIDEDSLQAQNKQASSGERISTKRAGGNWFNEVSTEVAKRRRQTLSINNALMALTDMVMEHGREKLMRNRENLRYHMYVQG